MTSFSMEDIDTSNVTNMKLMFGGCTSLQNIDISNLDTSNVNTMNNMFANCSSLQNINLKNFDTGRLTDMTAMFFRCTSLQLLDLSDFDVKNVLGMGGVFDNVTAKLNLSGWKIKKQYVINNSRGDSMLFGNNKSKEIVAKNWDVSSAGELIGLFARCSSLESLDISGWTFGTGHIAHGFFAECTSLSAVTGINEWQLSSFDLNSAPFAAICQNCTALGNKLTGGIWNNGTWSNGTFTPST